MKRFSAKVLSAIMVMLMALSMVSPTVFAADDEAVEAVIDQLEAIDTLQQMQDKRYTYTASGRDDGLNTTKFEENNAQRQAYENYIAEMKAKRVAAQKAYDSLSVEQKAQISTELFAKLNDELPTVLHTPTYNVTPSDDEYTFEVVLGSDKRYSFGFGLAYEVGNYMISGYTGEDEDNHIPQTFILVDTSDGKTSWTPNGKYVYGESNYDVVYCCDAKTGVAYGTDYKRVNLEDSEYYGPIAAKQIRAILQNSYPFVSIEQMKANLKAGGMKRDFVDDLTRADIISAVQMAVWTFANVNDAAANGLNYFATVSVLKNQGNYFSAIHDYTNELWDWHPGSGGRSYDPEAAYRVNNLAYYLCNLDGVEAQEDEVVISEVKVTRAELFEGSGDTYNVGMYIHLTGNDADDNLKVLITSTAPDGTVTGRSNQVVAGRDTLNMTVKSKPGDTIKVVVEGTQTVARGVYFYEPEPVYGSEDYDDDEADRKTSQSFVGVSEGATKVRAEEDFVFEQDIENGLRIYKTAEGTGLPISDITFNVYKVDAEQDISAVPTESELEKYAVESNRVDSITTDSTGYAYIALEDGIYLVTENKSDKVEAPVAPFYISIPMTVTKESDDGTTYTEVTNIASIYPKNKPTTPEEPPINPPIPDEVKGRFAIRKVNELNDKIFLAGAEFEVYRTATDDDADTKIIDYNGGKLAVVPMGITLVTDENGYAEIKEGEEIPTGVYFLVETKAPDGFNLPAEAFKVYAESDLLGEPKEVMIENAPGNILPETGGIGTHVFTAAGCVMTAIAGAVLIFRKKTKA